MVMSNKLKKAERSLIGGFDQESSYSYEKSPRRQVLSSTAELESRVSTYKNRNGAKTTKVKSDQGVVVGGSASFGFENDDSLLGGGTVSDSSVGSDEESVSVPFAGGGTSTDSTSFFEEIGGGTRKKSGQRSSNSAWKVVARVVYAT